MIVAETQLLFKLQDKSEEPPWFIVAGVALKLLITQLAGGGVFALTLNSAITVPWVEPPGAISPISRPDSKTSEPSCSSNKVVPSPPDV